MPDTSAALPSLADSLMGPMMSRLNQAPTFAHLWDMDQKLAGLSAAWTALHAANAAYQALIARGWGMAQQNLLAKSATAAAKPADWRAGTDAWLAELNAVLLELMRSDEYLALQKRLLDAGLQVREQLRKLGEDLAEWSISMSICGAAGSGSIAGCGCCGVRTPTSSHARPVNAWPTAVRAPASSRCRAAAMRPL